MKDKQKKILQDLRAYLAFEIDKGEYHRALATLAHDVRGLVYATECFEPRSAGYHEDQDGEGE